jgi:hypothetical protein
MNIKNRIKKMKKNIQKQRVLDTLRLVALNVAVISLLLIILNSSLLVYPKENLHTRNSKIAFEWIGINNAKLDDNPYFTSPVAIEKNNPVIELNPGIYYWKSGFGRTHKFTIESEVSISVTSSSIENETAYRIENQGNTRVLLDLIGLITGRVILEPNAVTYEKNVSDIEKIVASQNE